MQQIVDFPERRTTADAVFEQLRDEIVSLRLLPGTKLSEVEVARRFGVSRQPVRDAFSRLGTMDMLLIRPQKATEVRGFSMERIAHARFIRLAVELEVVCRASALWERSHAETLERNLEQQRQAVDAGELESFHALDYQFHRLVCELSGNLMAFKTIADMKQQVDRLCVLSLGRQNELTILLEDHVELAGALEDRSETKAKAIVRRHLSRLDDTITDIHRSHAEYFE